MAGSVADGAAEFDTRLASFVRENRLYGAAAGVVHGDDLAWSGGAGFADMAAGRATGPDVLYRIASITKTFTGTAIMRLRDAGKLDLDDSVVKWVPELADSATPETIGGVTIRRLLSHESGLVSEPPGTDFMAVQPTYQGVAARNLERVSEIFTAVPPNTQLKYCNLGYQLLGEIVSRVSETPYPQYLAEQILAPLGMTSTGFEPLAPELASRCAVGYAGRAFSDELAIAPSMPLHMGRGRAVVDGVRPRQVAVVPARRAPRRDCGQRAGRVASARGGQSQGDAQAAVPQRRGMVERLGHLVVLGPQGRRHLGSALGRAARIRVERVFRPELAGRRDRAGERGSGG